MKIKPSFKYLVASVAFALLSGASFALDAGTQRAIQLEPMPQQSQAARLAAAKT